MFFVILTTQNVTPAPMMLENEELATFDTEVEAEEAAKDNILGKHFGYEIYEW
jgi:hypothetical protein